MLRHGIVIGLLASTAMAQQQEYKVHILKEGETLSELLYLENYSPLYGKGNWVEKIIEANHLNKNSISKIKKGYPIILPKQPENIAKVEKLDEVSTKQAASVSYGLLGNRISRHQEIQVLFSYYQRSTNTDLSHIQSQENYALGINYEDKNNREFLGFAFNPEVEFGIHTHGNNDTRINSVINYEPTYYFSTKFKLDSKIFDYSFGPMMNIEESSRAHIIDDEYQVRRDRSVWMGVFAEKQYNINNILLNFGASLQAITITEQLKGLDKLQGTRGTLSFDVNLTRDYYIGLFTQVDQFYSGETQEISATGLNLNYWLN